MFWRERDRASARLIPYDADRPAVEAARRDPVLFEALYRKYVGQVYSFAVYELRDHHAAEDLTEQVFLRALTALPRFQERGAGDDSTFRVWLFRIARNALSNERRRERRARTEPLELAFELPSADDVADRALERDTMSRVRDALGRLHPDRRRAVVLRFVEQMTTREIAAVLERSEGAVRVLIHRALRDIADDLDRDA